MKKITLLFTAIALAFTYSVNAQDTCGTATPVLEGAITGTTITDATLSAEMTLPDGDNAAWFVYTATGDGFITVKSCGGGADTDLAVGTGTCGALVVSDLNDDFCDLGDGNDWASSVTIPVTNTVDYYIEWSDEWEAGPFDWSIAFFPATTNDDCVDAIALACDDMVSFSTIDATLDNDVLCGTPSFSPNVWYTYQGPGVGMIETITLTTCGIANYDTKLYVYSGGCGTLVCEATNDDFTGCAEFTSQVEFTSDGTTVYYIAVSGYSIAPGGDGNVSAGTGNLSITCVPAVTAPVNNLCAGALPLAYGVALTGDNTNATAAIANPTCDEFGVISDLWYSFVGSASGEVTLTSTIGTADNAWIAVYDSCGGTELGCASGALIGGGTGSDGTAGGKQLELSGLDDTITYYVQVWNDGATARETGNRVEGTFDIMVEEGLLSTTDFDNGLAFSFYPNPVSNNLALNAQNNIENVFVYNMLGQVVLKATPNTVSTEINMSELQSGAYFVKVSINGNTETVKIIKN